MAKKLDKQIMPVLPLRDVVVYPNMVVPLFVGRQKSIRSLEDAMNENNKTILLVTQKSADIDDPIDSELYKIGCSATILQLLKLPDGTMKVLVEGVARQKISKFTETNEILYSECEQLDANKASVGSQNDALGRALEDTFNNYVKLNKKIPPEVMSSIAGIEDLSKLSDSIAAHMTMRLEEKQKVLELFITKERVEYLIKAMESELDVLHVEKKFVEELSHKWKKAKENTTLTSR